MKRDKPNPFLFVFNRVKSLLVFLLVFLLGWGLLPFVWDRVPKLNVVEIIVFGSIMSVGLAALSFQAMWDYDKLYGKD